MSWASVLDLLDDRYLDIQDVTGNVEPFPELVPYEEYQRAILVYRIEEKLDFFLSRIQEFTDRTAVQMRKELWTWYIQWAVKSATEPPNKKTRLSLSDVSQMEKPIWKTGYRLLRRQIFQEPDVLRILIDIVQVESKLVPNYIEFLYQWVDFYLGDGTALKAAMRMEIPSLWLFEYHPRPVVQQSGFIDADAGQIGERLGRQKPDIDALEAMTEESERLKYREPKFGIQPPIKPNEEPLPPLINIPRDETKRKRYYAACFKNRQRALHLLQEAGVSARQVANYKKLQQEDPRETLQDADGDGFINFYHDEPYAHMQFIAVENYKRVREKQKEIVISSRLALEAQLAAVTQTESTLGETSDGRTVPPPLIPPTPTYASHSNKMNMNILQRIAALRKKPSPFVPVIPGSVLPRLNSSLFNGSKSSRFRDSKPLNPSQWEDWPWEQADGSGNSSNDDDTDYSTQYSYSGDDIDPDERDSDDDTGDDGPGGGDVPIVATVSGSSPLPPPGHLGRAVVPQGQPALPLGQHTFPSTQYSFQPGHHALQPGQQPAFQPGQLAEAGPPDIAAYIQNLTHSQVVRLIPLLNGLSQWDLQGRMSQPTALNGPDDPTVPLRTPIPEIVRLNPQPNVQNMPIAGPAYGVQPHNPSQLSQHMPTSSSPLDGAMLPASNAQAPVAQQMPIRLQGNAVPQPTQFFGPGSIARPAAPIQGLPHGATAFPPPQFLNQSAARAAPPPSLNLQPPTPTYPTPRPASSPSPVHMTPLANNLANSLTLANPSSVPPELAPDPGQIALVIYMPKVLMRPGTHPDDATDCMLLAYTRPGSGDYDISRAILLSVNVWENTLRRARMGHFKLVEVYRAPANHPRNVAGKGVLRNPEDVRGPHRAMYEKLTTIYGFMAGCEDREQELTKRWRAARGAIRETKWGAVWEGWGVYVDRPVEMRKEERKGADKSGVEWIGEEVEVDPEVERRQREIHELLEEEDSWYTVEE